MTAILTSSSAVIREPGAQDAEMVRRWRGRIRGAVKHYMTFKHAAIFDPIIAQAKDPAIVAKARRAKSTCVAMNAQFDAYSNSWSVELITQNWAEFRLSTGAMIERYSEHTAQEKVAITELVGIFAP